MGSEWPRDREIVEAGKDFGATSNAINAIQFFKNYWLFLVSILVVIIAKVLEKLAKYIKWLKIKLGYTLCNELQLIIYQ